MKLFSLKKSLAVLISLALTVSIFGASYVTSAEGNTYWQEATLDLSDKMNADNWTILEGDTDTLNSSNLPLIKYGDSYATLSMKNSSPTTIGRISPKLPENARILEFSYDVYTKAESHHKPLALIYSFKDIDNYSAIGIANYTTWAKMSCTSGTDKKNSNITVSEKSTNWNIKISYTYNDDETVSCNVVATSKSNSAVKVTQSATNVKPAAVLSGGSTLATNMTNTFGKYTNVSVKYEVEIDLDKQIEDFKSENPLPELDSITYNTAIEDGRKANTVIEAIAAVSNTNLKEALADYEAEAKAIVAKANAFITKTYKVDFDDETTTNKLFSAAQVKSQPNIDPTSYSNTAYTHENGVLKVTETTNTSATGYNIKMLKSPDNAAITVASGKFAIGSESLRIYLKNDNSDSYDSGFIVVNYTASNSKLTSVTLKVYSKTANGSIDNKAKTSNNKLYNINSDVSALNIAAPNTSDASTYLTFKYALISNMPVIYIYAPNVTEPIAGISAQFTDTTKGYHYTGMTSIGFTAPKGTAYINDLQIEYAKTAALESFTGTLGDSTNQTCYKLVDSKSLVAPEIQGASIVKTEEIDKQDLRFEAKFDTNAAVTTGYTAVEYGMILMTKAKMPVNNLLEMTSVGNGALDIIIAKAEVSDDTIPSTFYVELSGSGAANENGEFDSSTIVGKRFYARAYIAYKNAAGEKIYAYSDNDIENKIENGQASKSVIGVAKAIASQQLANGASDTDGSIQTIIDASSTNSETRQKLLQFVCYNQSYLNN